MASDWEQIEALSLPHLQSPKCDICGQFTADYEIREVANELGPEQYIICTTCQEADDGGQE